MLVNYVNNAFRETLTRRAGRTRVLQLPIFYCYVMGKIKSTSRSNTQNVVPRSMLYSAHRLQFVSASRCTVPVPVPVAHRTNHTFPDLTKQTISVTKLLALHLADPKIAISTAFGPNVASRALNGSAVRSNVGWWPSQVLHPSSSDQVWGAFRLRSFLITSSAQGRQGFPFISHPAP